MDIKKEISQDRVAKVIVEVPNDQVASEYLDALKAFQKNAKIPGFRPGKVPLTVVRSQYGKEIIFEKAEELTKNYIGEVLNENRDLEPGGQISLNLLEYGEKKPLRFEVSFPLRPKVELKKYKGLRITLNNAEISDQDIDNEIEAQRRQFAIMRSVDTPSTPNSKLELSVVEVDPNGLMLINRKPETHENFQFGMDELGIGTDEQLIGIRAGEKRIVKIQQQDGLTQSTSKSLILTPDEAQRDSNSNEIYYSVEALQVEESELPEIDEEFARRVDPSLNSVEDLRKWMEINLLGMVSYTRRHYIENKIVTILLEENPFLVHASIIDMFLNEAISEKNMSEEDAREYFESNREDIDRQYRWVLLRDKIAEEENLEVTEEEIQQEMENIAKQTRKPFEEVSKYYEGKDSKDRLIGNLFDRKVIGFLIDNASIDERKLTMGEFFRSMSQELEQK